MGALFTRNLLGVLIGLGIILLCLAISYFFQKNLFMRYRRRVSNTAAKEKRE